MQSTLVWVEAKGEGSNYIFSLSLFYFCILYIEGRKEGREENFMSPEEQKEEDRLILSVLGPRANDDGKNGSVTWSDQDAALHRLSSRFKGGSDDGMALWRQVFDSGICHTMHRYAYPGGLYYYYYSLLALSPIRTVIFLCILPCMSPVFGQHWFCPPAKQFKSLLGSIRVPQTFVPRLS